MPHNPRFGPQPATFIPPPSANTRHKYDLAYLRWMQKTNHPDLAKSNYNADKFLQEMKERKLK